MVCKTCQRGFHLSCISSDSVPIEDWIYCCFCSEMQQIITPMLDATSGHFKNCSSLDENGKMITHVNRYDNENRPRCCEMKSTPDERTGKIERCSRDLVRQACLHGNGTNKMGYCLKHYKDKCALQGNWSFKRSICVNKICDFYEMSLEDRERIDPSSRIIIVVIF
jgi:hypothetical protein